MRVVDRLSRLVLRVAIRIVGSLKTGEGRTQANLGFGTRVLADGRIVNIGGGDGRICLGTNARIRGEVLTFRHAGRIRIGDWFYLGPGSTIWSSDPEGIVIGDRVLVSMRVTIHDTDSHPLDPARRFELTREMFLHGHPQNDPGIRSAPIVIGDDVWIGLGATILKGVKIGCRAIIGAHAVVASDVPDDGYVPTPRHVQASREA
jgi:acetyltransferase-like isoleucine patch superfamily enzyme